MKRSRTRLHPESAQSRMRQCSPRGFPTRVQDLRSHRIESISRLNLRQKIRVRRLRDRVQNRPDCQDLYSCCRKSGIRNRVSVWFMESSLPNHSKCPSVEVALHAEYDGLPLLNTLLLIGPLTREFDSCFHSFCTSVHWQYHVVFEERCYLLGERPEI